MHYLFCKCINFFGALVVISRRQWSLKWKSEISFHDKRDARVGMNMDKAIAGKYDSDY